MLVELEFLRKYGLEFSITKSRLGEDYACVKVSGGNDEITYTVHTPMINGEFDRSYGKLARDAVYKAIFDDFINKKEDS